MIDDHARFEQEVLDIVRRWLSNERVTGRHVFYRIELEGEYPDTEVVMEQSTSTDLTRHTQRFAIWSPEFTPQDDADSIGGLIMTWALGG